MQYVNHVLIGRDVFLLCFDCGFGCAARIDCGFIFRFLFGFGFLSHYFIFGFDFLSHYFIFGFDPELLEQANSTLNPPSLHSSPIQAKQQATRTSQPLLFLLLVLPELRQCCAALHIRNQKRLYRIANVRFAAREAASLDRFANIEEGVLHEGGAEAKRAAGEGVLEDGEIDAERCVAVVQCGERTDGLGVGEGSGVQKGGEKGEIEVEGLRRLGGNGETWREMAIATFSTTTVRE